MPDKFEQYYKYLKANGADVAPDFNSFKNTLSDSNKASKYYSYLKENQFDVPETFDSFANTFGLKKKAGDLLSSGIPSRLPNEPNFLQQGQKVASGEIFTDISKSVPKTTLKDAAIKDKQNNNSYLGAMWNNVVASAERLAGGAARLAQKFDTSPVSMIQETVDKAASSVTGINYEAQREKEIADKVKSFIGKARTSSSSREYEQGLAEGFDITNGIGLDDLKGLGAVLPSMLTDMAIAAPTGGATFAIQGYDDALSTLDNIPEAKYMSETTRTAFGFGGAIVAGVLEKLGMDNILKSGTVTKYVTSKILKETAGELAKKGVKVTAEQFEKAVANKATQMLTKTALKNTVKAGAKSALSEGATEATQEGAMDLIKLAANQLEGSEIFDEKDLKNTAASRYLNAAAMGGIFGGTLGSIGSRTKNVQQHIEDEVKNAKTQEDIAAIIDDINENLKDGTISENDAEVFKSMVDKDISKPSTLEIQNEKETKLSDIDEFINSLDRNDRLYNDKLNELNKEKNQIISFYDDLSKKSQKDEETSFDDGKVPTEEEMITEEVTPTGVKIGDAVQWTSQGADQFAEPRKIKSISEDGEYAFIEGSDTGIPVKELSVTELTPTEVKVTEEGGVGAEGEVEIKNEGKADAPTKESVTERLNINNPFYKKVEDALVKLGLIEKYNPETGTGDVVGGYAQPTSDGGFSVGKMLFSKDGSISYFDGDVKVSFDKNGNVISENTKEAKQEAVRLKIEGTKEFIASLEKTRDSESFKYKEVTETDILGNKKKVKRLKTEQELKESADKINAAIDKAKAELSNLEQSPKETPKAGVKPTEVKEEVKIEEPVSTQKVKIPGTKQSKPIPLSDFTLGKEGERSFTKRVKKDEGGVSGVEPLNQFKLNQGMDSYGNPYPRVHVILDDADAEKYQAFFSAGGKKVAKNPEFRDEINKIAKANRSKTDEVVLDFRNSEIDALTKKSAVKPTEEKPTEVKVTEKVEPTEEDIDFGTAFKMQDATAESTVGKNKDNWGESQVWRERIENAGDILRELSSRGQNPDAGYILEKVEKLKDWIDRNKRYPSQKIPNEIKTIEDFKNSNLKNTNALDSYDYLNKFHSDILNKIRNEYEEINTYTKEQRLARDLVLDLINNNIEGLESKLNDIENIANKVRSEGKLEIVKDVKLGTKTKVKTTEVKAEDKSPVSIPEEVFNPIINKIKKGIEKLSTTAKVSVLKDKNFSKALDEAIKNGKVNLQSWGGFEKKGFEESPQWQKLIDDGTVKLNFDLKGLEGKPVVVINPDNMLTGAVVTKNGKPIIDGNGGINFVTKFGDVWASSDNATANTLARYINEARSKDIAAGGDGTVHVVVTKGDLSKSLTSHTGAKAAMKVLEHLVDKKYVSLSDFRKALTDVGKKYNIDLDGRLDAKSIHDDIAKKFFGVNDSTFSKRGFFVQDVIDHLAKNSQSAKENIGKIRTMLNTEALPKSTERKTGEISFAKEGIIDAIGHLLSDNMTVGVKNSEAYATIEIKHPVEVFNLNKEEGGHESYPFHLRQIDESGNKVKPILNVLGKAQHVTDVLNDANNQKVDKKGGAGKFGSNQIGMAKGFVKPASEHPSGVNLMTDATGKIYGFEQNGKIVLNADLMNGNTPFHEAGHLWLNWAKENRSDLHDAGIRKVENSKYLQDVKNNKVYQENAAKLPKGEREAYFKEEALAKAIGDNGERFVNEAQKSDFRKWVKNLWETIATHFGLRGMTADEVSNLTLDEFSKKVVADIVSDQKGEKEAQKEKTTEEVYKDLTRIEKRQIINSKFDELIKELKIEKICPT